MNRRQLFRNALSLAGAAAVAPSILNEALPEEEILYDRVAVQVFEQGGWSRIAGLDYIKSGQIFRFVWPDSFAHKLIDDSLEHSWFGVAAEDGNLVQAHEGNWVGGALSDFFPTLEAQGVQ